MNNLSAYKELSLRSTFIFIENHLSMRLRIQQKKVALVALAILSVLVSVFIYNRSLLRSKASHLLNFIFFPKKPALNLILHLDINRTIIAEDSSAGFDLQSILAMLLAENTSAKWAGKETTFREYIYSLIPGAHHGPIKKQRQSLLKDFIHLLKTSSFQKESTIDFEKLKEHREDKIENVKKKIDDVKQQVLEDLNRLTKENPNEFEKLKEKSLSMYEKTEKKLLQQSHGIFPSFFRLIEWLRKQENLHFHIILRTFGSDAQRIVVEIEKQFPEEKFNQGSYLKGQWSIQSVGNQSYIFNKAKDIYKFFKSKNYQHLAIKDDWEEWNKNQEDHKHGKRFPVKLNSKHTHFIFIDDNIEENPFSEKNIVTAMDSESNKFLPLHCLVNKQIAIRANTLAAIADDHYFIKVIQQSLKLNGKMIA